MSWALNELVFSKYQGAGNDFILVDNRALDVNLTKEFIFKVCNRNYGIGADGIILLCPSTKASYRMRIFNSDGSEAEMCGNGIRCLYAFILDLEELNNNDSIETLGGIYKCHMEEGRIFVQMRLPVIEKHNESEFFINSGVPHYVRIVEDLTEFDRQAPSLFFNHGININFVKITGPNSIMMRTFERGVESETLSCGSGAVASAIAAWKHTHMSGKIWVTFHSNEKMNIDLDVAEKTIRNVTLSGFARKVFCGRLSIIN